MSNEPAIKGAPAAIYLQCCDAEHCEVPFSEHEGTTWCADKINDLDVEYVRADLVNDDTALLRQALEALVAAGLSAHKTKQVREQAITALRERLKEST